MKSNLLNVTIAAVCCLPLAGFAQGTYLSDPTNDANHALVVGPGGNVGIGIVNPGRKLSVYGTVGAGDDRVDGPPSQDFAFSGGAYGGSLSNWLNSGSNPLFFRLLGDGDPHSGYGIVHGHNIQSPVVWFYAEEDRNCFQVRSVPYGKAISGGSALMTVRQRNSHPRVGIGTEDPQTTLHVEGDVLVSNPVGSTLIHITAPATPYLRLERTSEIPWAWDVAVDANSSLSFYDVITRVSRLVVARDGNVGIGTTSPAAKLDVAGKVNCTVLELTSDRAQKSGFAPVDRRAILDQVAHLPITTWQYTNEPAVVHIGPVAQDFKAPLQRRLRRQAHRHRGCGRRALRRDPSLDPEAR